MASGALGRKVTYPIRSFHGDLYGRVKPHFVLSFFEDIAWQNAEELGFGYTALLSQGRFWALTRLLLDVWRWPHWGETLVLETEPLGVSGPFAIRRFGGSVGGESCFEASSAWVVLDAETRKPLRPQSVFTPEDLAGLPGFERDQVPGKVEDVLQATGDTEGGTADSISSPEAQAGGRPETAVVRREVPATYTELDVNAHVNNAEFLRWAFSLVPTAALDETPARRIEINFLSELREGQAMTLTGRFTDRDVLVAGVAAEEPIFRCRIRF